MSLADLLRDARKRKRLTQDDLAATAGVSRSSIIRWEQGSHEAQPEALRDVAEALGIPPVEAFEAIGWLPSDEDHRRELRKIKRAVDAAVTFHTHTNEANAALHLSDRVMYSPMTAELVNAQAALATMLGEDV